jgi:hypothetical protein
MHSTCLRPVTSQLQRDGAMPKRSSAIPSRVRDGGGQEEAERKLLTREVQSRVGSQLLLETLTGAVDGHAESTYACAVKFCDGDEALAKVASGAALTSIHLRALALLAGRGELHVFVQKYALFAAGRFPLGMRRSTFTFF